MTDTTKLNPSIEALITSVVDSLLLNANDRLNHTLSLRLQPAS